MDSNSIEYRHIIAILRGIKPEEISPVCSALINAGISMVEITLNSPDPLVSIKDAVRQFGESVMIGAGTVLSTGDVDDVAGVGGKFIVSPDCQTAVIERTIERNMKSYPGVFTPSEAFTAIRAGATGLKFFPGELIGPRGIAAMKAVLPPTIPVYAVGGANPDNFSEYFKAGCAGFGLGSFLYKPGRSSEDVATRANLAVEAYDQHSDNGW